MKLYLVQHGEACAKDVDPERPLTVQGRADVERMAVLMRQAGIRVERVIHSGKLRARQTAELLAKAMSPRVEAEVSGLMNPNDNPTAFDWQSESWDRDTLIVGHLPFMGRLVSHLLIEDADRALVSFQPGSMACLEHAGAERWLLNWMLRPELLES
jgi:phosphohistidine phosphatase